MSIKLQIPRMTDMRPRLTVMGIGGAGCNAINNMIASGLTGVDFIVANTDAQALASSSAERRVQLGASLTEGLGAGSKPEVGEAAAEEALEELKSQIIGSHMLFIAAGMGGGTGTGAAAVVARTARDLGILTVAIVTKPFQFEGARRQRIAEIGIAELRQYVDTLIVIPNQNLFRVANERTTFAEAFVMADQVLYSGVACIVDLIIKEGLINLDFADVRTVLAGMGTAMMGTGEAAGERRAIEAAEEAIANPLLDDVSLRGARGLLLSISGGRDLTLYEVDEAASRVRSEVDPEANIIVGATFDESLGDRVRVSIVASGMLRQSEIPREPGQGHLGSIPLPGFAGSTPPSFRDGASRDAVPREMPVLDFSGSAHQAPPAQPLSELPRRDHVKEQPPSAGARSSPLTQPPAPPFMAPAQPQAEVRFQPVPTAPDDNDVQRRLSMALQGPDLDDRPDGMPPVPHRSEARGDLWQAPGSVMIEESGPLAHHPKPLKGQPQPAVHAQPHAPAHAPAHATGAGRMAKDEASFVPEMPVEIRRQPRRVPEIDEFPQVAQREYRGRVDTQGKDGPSPARKPGLFERLTGMSRRADDSPDDYPSHDVSPVKNRNENVGQGRQPSRAAPQRGPDPSSSAGSQGSDMPALFRKERR